jgi:hypothetical protein
MSSLRELPYALKAGRSNSARKSDMAAVCAQRVVLCVAPQGGVRVVAANVARMQCISSRWRRTVAPLTPVSLLLPWLAEPTMVRSASPMANSWQCICRLVPSASRTNAPLPLTA